MLYTPCLPNVTCCCSSVFVFVFVFLLLLFFFFIFCVMCHHHIYNFPCGSWVGPSPFRSMPSWTCLLPPCPPNGLPVYLFSLSEGPPPLSVPDDQLSSASIFEHVDRMSRAAEGSKRLTNKIQLIAMQPMPALPTHSPTVVDGAAENAKLNKEVCSPHQLPRISCLNSWLSLTDIRPCVSVNVTQQGDGFCVCASLCV